MSFEITTEEEYIALVTCVSLYVMYKQITLEKENEKAHFIEFTSSNACWNFDSKKIKR